MVNWSDFNRFEPVIKLYMPNQGEGDSIASQIVTAVNKLVYKWFNDGDVYDNTHGLQGWANNISSYANWLYKYTPAADILERIYNINTEAEYEELLYDLADMLLDSEWLAQWEESPKSGSIYNCDGPFEFVEYEDEDDYDDYEYDDDYDDYDDDDYDGEY